MAAAGGDSAGALLLAAEDVLTLRRVTSFGLMRGLLLNVEKQGDPTKALDEAASQSD